MKNLPFNKKENYSLHVLCTKMFIYSMYTVVWVSVVRAATVHHPGLSPSSTLFKKRKKEKETERCRRKK